MEAVLPTSHLPTASSRREVTISAVITEIAKKTDQRARSDLLSGARAEGGRKRSDTYPTAERPRLIDRRPHSDSRLPPDTSLPLGEKQKPSPCTCPDRSFMTKAVWDAIASSPVVIDSHLRTHLCPQKSHGKMVSCEIAPATERRTSLGEVTPKSSPNSSPHERKRGGLLTSPGCTCPKGKVTISDTFWWKYIAYAPKSVGDPVHLHTCPITLHGRVVCFAAPSMLA